VEGDIKFSKKRYRFYMKKSETSEPLGVLTRHAMPYVNTLLYAWAISKRVSLFDARLQSGGKTTLAPSPGGDTRYENKKTKALVPCPRPEGTQ
jgi:hypothetical protein